MAALSRLQLGVVQHRGDMPVAEPDQFRQHGLVDVVERVDVQAAGTVLVLAELAEQFGGLRPVREAIE